MVGRILNSSSQYRDAVYESKTLSRAAILRGILRTLALLPLPVAHGLGAMVGQLVAWLPTELRRVTDTNLALCFPEMPSAQRRRLTTASLREMGKQLLETGIVWYCGEKRLQRLVVNPDSLDRIASHWPAGRGLLLAGPHLGNWELVSLYVNRRFRVHNLYRPPRQRDLEPLLVEVRERTGARSLPATPNGIRTLYRALKEGGLVGILPDQEPKDSGHFAPFFAMQAKTMTLLCQMASRTGAPVLFTFMERLPWGRGFRLHVVPAPAGIDDPDAAVATAALNKGVEQCVRMAPHQYQWSYKRFRQQPDGKPNPYKTRHASA